MYLLPVNKPILPPISGGQLRVSGPFVIAMLVHRLVGDEVFRR